MTFMKVVKSNKIITDILFIPINALLIINNHIFRSLIPEWNQTLIINESFDYIMQNVNNIIIFFEVVDFITLSETLHHKGLKIAARIGI